MKINTIWRRKPVLNDLKAYRVSTTKGFNSRKWEGNKDLDFV